jgi:ornithine decarboxylase antizyme 1
VATLPGVSTEQLCNGSKEAFVSLLEYAEDVLHCEHVIICLDKNSTNPRDTKMAIRNFLFLGFQPLAPGHEFVPSNPNLVSILSLQTVYLVTKFYRFRGQFLSEKLP